MELATENTGEHRVGFFCIFLGVPCVLGGLTILTVALPILASS